MCSRRWMEVAHHNGSVYYANGSIHRRTPGFDDAFSWTRWRAVARLDSDEGGWHRQRTAAVGSCR